MSFARSTLHVAVPETDLAVSYTADMSQFLWDKLLPVKIVNKGFNTIRQFDKPNMLRRRDMRVGNNGVRVQFKMAENLTYQTTDFMLEALMDDRDRQGSDDIIQYDNELIKHLTLAYQINMEFMTIYQTLRVAANYGGNTEDLSANGGVRQYDAAASADSDPVSDFRNIVTKSRHKLGGKAFNKVVMSLFTWQKIQENKNVLALGRMATYEQPYMLMRLFEEAVGLPPGAIQISEAVYNDSLEDQTAVYKTFIGTDIIFLFVEPAQTRFYGAGLSYMYPGGILDGGLENLKAPFSMLMLPDNGQETVFGGTKMRLAGGIDQKVMNTEAMYLLRNAINKNDTAYGDLLKDPTNP